MPFDLSPSMTGVPLNPQGMQPTPQDVGGQEPSMEPPPQISQPSQPAYHTKASLSDILPALLAGVGSLAFRGKGNSGRIGDELGEFAKGWANARIQNIMNERKDQHESENFMIQHAHDAMMDIDKLDLASVDAPQAVKDKVMAVRGVYNKAISDGKITPKEAQEIMAYASMAKRMFDSAKSTYGSPEAAAGRKGRGDLAGAVEAARNRGEANPEAAAQTDLQHQYQASSPRSIKDPNTGEELMVSPADYIKLTREQRLKDEAGKRADSAFSRAAMSNQRLAVMMKKWDADTLNRMKLTLARNLQSAANAATYNGQDAEGAMAAAEENFFRALGPSVDLPSGKTSSPAGPSAGKPKATLKYNPKTGAAEPIKGN